MKINKGYFPNLPNQHLLLTFLSVQLELILKKRKLIIYLELFI